MRRRRESLPRVGSVSAEELETMLRKKQPASHTHDSTSNQCTASFESNDSTMTQQSLSVPLNNDSTMTQQSLNKSKTPENNDSTIAQQSLSVPLNNDSTMTQQSLSVPLNNDSTILCNNESDLAQQSLTLQLNNESISDEILFNKLQRMSGVRLGIVKLFYELSRNQDDFATDRISTPFIVEALDSQGVRTTVKSVHQTIYRLKKENIIEDANQGVRAGGRGGTSQYRLNRNVRKSCRKWLNNDSTMTQQSLSVPLNNDSTNDSTSSLVGRLLSDEKITVQKPTNKPHEENLYNEYLDIEFLEELRERGIFWSAKDNRWAESYEIDPLALVISMRHYMHDIDKAVIGSEIKSKIAFFKGALKTNGEYISESYASIQAKRKIKDLENQAKFGEEMFKPKDDLEIGFETPFDSELETKNIQPLENNSLI